MFKMFSQTGSTLRPALQAAVPASARIRWAAWVRACALGAGLALSLAGPVAQAQGKAAEAGDGAQAKPQNRMSRCSADFKATGRPGSERKAFMSECLRKPKQAS